MSKQPGSHNTPRAVVEEILRLHVEEGYTYRQLAEKFHKPFKTIQNMIHNGSVDKICFPSPEDMIK